MAPAAANQELRPSANTVVKDPLSGFPSCMVTAKQVLPVMASPSTLMLQMGEVNPFNKSFYSASYKKILDSKMNLPVFSQMHEFYEMVRIPQFVVYSDLPQTKGKIVACTQPRRVAAMSVAKRVAEEMDGVFMIVFSPFRTLFHIFAY